MEQDQEKVVERSSSGRSKWIVLLVIAVIVLAAGCVLLFVWKSKDKEEDDGGKIGYDTNAVVVTEEDELQKLADEMNKNDGEISLEYKNVATSQDGSNFNCYIANSAKNRYDMYVGIYTDVNYSEELYLSKLMKPGSGIKNFQCKKKPEPGVHDVVMVFTFVENDHATIHSQTNVTYTLHVEE